MIKNSNESRSLVVRNLPKQIDPLLFRSGFRRIGKSHRYHRRYQDAKQKIEIELDHKYDSSCVIVAQVLPFLEISIPTVNQIAFKMAQGLDVIGDPDITLRQQIHITIPRVHRRTWYYSNESECKEALTSVNETLGRWTIPFLDEYGTALGITSNYEAGDERVFSQKHWYIYVSAAYLIQGRRAEAKEVLESKLTGFWTRKRFAPAFEYVERLL